MDTTSALRSLSTDDISSVFENVQKQRQDRVWDLIEAAHMRQRLECMETPTLKFIVRYVFPYMPKKMVMHRWIHTYCPAVSLNMLPQPNRPRKIPFHDELPSPSATSESIGIVIYGGGTALACVAVRQLFDAGRENGIWAFVHGAVTSVLSWVDYCLFTV